MKMNKGFYYIVVTLGTEIYFVNKDMDYTDNFDDVIRFDTAEQAQEHIEKHLSGKDAKTIPYL